MAHDAVSLHVADGKFFTCIRETFCYHIGSSLGYLKRRIQIPMAQGRSTEVISMIKWIQTSRRPIKKSLYVFIRDTA